ncbi:MAG TPA: hypothetical protein VG248_10775 [Caulobacteraceae bacterium]|jgi:hypothetical protein|nr:hypothetical protein [Caulobacteraceae bacterium]
MTKKILVLASVGALSLAPVLAHAQDEHRRCVDAKSGNAVAGAVIGGVGGALLGGAIGEHGGREGGAIIGGVGGAAAGAAIGAGSVHCDENRYGWYDDRGQWIPRDRRPDGYYGPDGRWVAMSAGPGYGPPPEGDRAYGARPYDDRGPGADMRDTRAREARLEQRIEHRMSDGRLDRDTGERALRRLSHVRDQDAQYRQYSGQLTPDQYRYIDGQLDQLSQWTRIED